MTERYIADAKKFFSEKVADKEGIATRAHKKTINAVKWSCDGSHLASASEDKTVWLWSAAGKLVRESELRGHTASVDQLCFSPRDKNTLVTAGADKSCRVWDTRSPNKSVVNISTGGENINICWKPDGNMIATGSKMDVITFIDTRTWKKVKTVSFDHEVNEMSWANSGSYLYMTCGNGTIELIDDSSFERAPPIFAHTSNCICIDFDPRGRYFATGSAGADVCIFDAYENICVGAIGAMECPIRRISTSFDGQLLSTSSEDPYIPLYHMSTQELVHRIPRPNGSHSLAWHPSQLLLAFAAEETTGGGTIVSLFGIPSS